MGYYDYQCFEKTNNLSHNDIISALLRNFNLFIVFEILLHIVKKSIMLLIESMLG